MRKDHVQTMRASQSRARDFTRTLFEVHQDLANEVAGRLDLTGVRQMMDLGGGQPRALWLPGRATKLGGVYGKTADISSQYGSRTSAIWYRHRPLFDLMDGLGVMPTPTLGVGVMVDGQIRLLTITDSDRGLDTPDTSRTHAPGTRAFLRNRPNAAGHRD